jgi:hypothetical protein
VNRDVRNPYLLTVLWPDGEERVELHLHDDVDAIRAAAALHLAMRSRETTLVRFHLPPAGELQYVAVFHHRSDS